MAKLTNSLIIHLFAILHFAVSLSCRAAGLADDLLLTLLTMVLAVVICLRRQTSGVFMVCSVIAVNVVGFVLGRCTATPLKLLLSSPLLIYPLSTLVSTEIIGLALDSCAKLDRKRHPAGMQENSGSTLRWMLVAFVVIIVIRLLLVVQSRGLEDTRTTIVGIVVDYVFSCLALILVAESAIKASNAAEAAKTEANLAQYRYLKLKQQVNPHFLFNSLNVLDCLIQEQSPEDASIFTHKLADIYRYLISNEEKTLVPLLDEMEFVGQYVDLLKIRWPEGIEVEVSISGDAMHKSVIPCCVQLLIENATKHNAVLPDDPLRIRICSDGESVSVTNNRHPKVSRASSTGLGLKYIRQQYDDLSEGIVEISESENEFKVKLPLI